MALKGNCFFFWVICVLVCIFQKKLIFAQKQKKVKIFKSVTKKEIGLLGVNLINSAN